MGIPTSRAVDGLPKLAKSWRAAVQWGVPVAVPCVAVLLSAGSAGAQCDPFPQRVVFQSSKVTAWASGNLDGDARADFASVASAKLFTAAAILDGYGTLKDYVTVGGAQCVCIADLNGDQRGDAVVGSSGKIVSIHLSTSAGILGPRVDYTTPAEVLSVATGDFNKDGAVDVVAAVTGTDVIVFLNKGNGTLLPGFAVPAIEGLASVAAADVDGDGDADIVAGSTTAPAIVVIKSLGNGQFATPAAYATGSTSAGFKLGRLNADLFPDVALAGPTGVPVLVNDGSGRYPRLRTAFGSPDIDSIAIGDVNKDGLGDLICFEYQTGRAHELLNTGEGFELKQTFTIPGKNASFVLDYRPVGADVDGDGDMDCVFGLYGTDRLALLENSGGGVFRAQATYPTVKQPTRVAAGDLNGDGLPDLVTTASGTTTVSVYRNIGGGRLAPRVEFTSGSSAARATIADLNGDGRPDLLVPHNNGVDVLLGLGTGQQISFAPKLTFSVGAGTFASAVGDIDHDSRTDVVLTGTDTVWILKGLGNGQFATPTTIALRNAGPCFLVDLNQDGSLDLAVVASTTCQLFENDGSGKFVASGTIPSVSGNLKIMDVTGDEIPDAVDPLPATSPYPAPGSISIRRGLGLGAFAPPFSMPVLGGGTYRIATYDIDGDGVLDLVGATSVDSAVYILRGMGGGLFGPATYYLGPTGQLPEFADMDLDGRPDMVTVNADGETLYVTMNVAGPQGVRTEPAVQTVCPAGVAAWSAVTPETLPVEYQWEFRRSSSSQWEGLTDGPVPDIGLVSGTTTQSLAVSNFDGSLLGDPVEVRCVLSNGCGRSVGNASRLEVCFADTDCSGAVDLDDFFLWLNYWASGDPRAETNGIAGVDLGDLFLFLNALDSGCPAA